MAETDGGNETEQTEVEIVGPTTENTTGPYGEPGCDETMHVIIDGEDVFVPWTGVRPGAYDYFDWDTDRFDVDRIVLYNGHIHADADAKDESIELYPEFSTATSEFRGYDSWSLEVFQRREGTMAPEDLYDRIVYERDGGDN